MGLSGDVRLSSEISGGCADREAVLGSDHAAGGEGVSVFEVVMGFG